MRHALGGFVAAAVVTDVSDVSPSFAWTSGANVSTAADVARFYRALLRVRLTSADALAAVEAVVPARTGSSTSWASGP